MALVTTAKSKQYLVSPAGKTFFALGVNYSGYFDRAWKMWEPDLFDPNLIALDFGKAQQSGFNTIRIFAHTALLKDIQKDKFDKLDQTLSLAQDHNLLVLLALNDAHYLNLKYVGKLDAKIAERYKGVSTVMGYDLENEPVFYNLIAAIYPADHPVPVHSMRLIDHYGERVSRSEAKAMQLARQIPGHLDDNAAYYYINALRLFLEYDADIRAFIKQGQGTLIDFMAASEANRWYTLIGVLDDTVAAWLAARMEPIRATGDQHLLTVGWNWLHFAGLPANQALDFQSYHNYASLSMSGFNTNLAHLEGLGHAFPNHPVTFGEFGWSNQTSTNPSSSRPVPPAETALYEAATYAYLRANRFAGGFKWMLNDVAGSGNPYEANFGVFSPGDQAKPVRDLLRRFSENWPSVYKTGQFNHLRDVEAGISYRLSLPEQFTLGGHAYQDDTISWQADTIAHCYLCFNGREILVDADGAGRVSFDPWDLSSVWDQTRETELYRVYSNTHRTLQRTFAAGENIVINLQPGVQYALAMGVETQTEPQPEPPVQVSPNPGEHVVLFGCFDDCVSSALAYLRRFTPDFTFAIDQVAGRWSYVSVVATPAQVPDQVLDDIRGAGAALVERVIGDTPEATKTLLDDMAARGARFLTAVVPPQDDPSPVPGEPPYEETPVEETYIVQSGDTLSKIAVQVYGDYRMWQLIFEANQDKIADPGLIRPGMELRLPTKA